MRCPRSSRAFVSPRAQRTASTRLLFPLPFGPTMAVIPGSKSTSLRAAKVLNPDRVIRRSLIGPIVHAWDAKRQHLGPGRSPSPKIWCSLLDRRCAPTAAAPATPATATATRGRCGRLGRRRRRRLLPAHQGLGGMTQRGQEAPAPLGRRNTRRGGGGLRSVAPRPAAPAARCGAAVGRHLGDSAADAGGLGGNRFGGVAGGTHGGGGTAPARLAQLVERVVRGSLLGRLLGRAASGPADAVSEEDLGGVLPLVARTAGGDDPVVRRVPGPVLGCLLQLALEVLVAPLGEVADVLEKDLGRRPVPLVEEDRADHRLEGVGEQRRQLARAGLDRAPPHQQGLAELEALAEPRQRGGVDQRGPKLGQLTLVVGGKSSEEVLADHELEDRVAQVLETFVVVPGTGRLAVLVVP